MPPGVALLAREEGRWERSAPGGIFKGGGGKIEGIPKKLERGKVLWGGGDFRMGLENSRR